MWRGVYQKNPEAARAKSIAFRKRLKESSPAILAYRDKQSRIQTLMRLGGHWPRFIGPWGWDKLRASINNIRRFGYQTIGAFTLDDLDELLTLQDGRCGNPFCSCDLRTDFIELDHKIPLSRGGTNFPDNLQFLCPPCNKRKYTRMFSDWLAFEADLHAL